MRQLGGRQLACSAPQRVDPGTVCRRAVAQVAPDKIIGTGSVGHAPHFRGKPRLAHSWRAAQQYRDPALARRDALELPFQQFHLLDSADERSLSNQEG
jgi:hypothetical protein